MSFVIIKFDDHADLEFFFSITAFLSDQLFLATYRRLKSIRQTFQNAVVFPRHVLFFKCVYVYMCSCVSVCALLIAVCSRHPSYICFAFSQSSFADCAPADCSLSRFSFSIASCSDLLLGNLSLLFSFFHFIRLFWNQILTCRSVSPKACDTSMRLLRVRYGLKRNSFSSSSVW